MNKMENKSAGNIANKKIKDKGDSVLVSDSKLYELAIEERKHKEDRRDEINTYYISIFAAIIAISPFIDKISEGVSDFNKDFIIKISLTILAGIGLILAIIWAANLKRLLIYLQSLDKMILELEDRYEVSFISYISQFLYKNNSPDRITKYQILLPYTFIVIFLCTIIYSLGWIVVSK